MPLTKREKKVKRAMRKTYGQKKGTRVFYAWERKTRKARRKAVR